MNLNKQIIRILILGFGFMVEFQVKAEAQWYEAIQWYENELGVKQDQLNSLHLAETLVECFSHDPQDVVAFDKAIKFWLSCGGDINQTFNMSDFWSLGQWAQLRYAELPAKYKNKQVTVLMLFIGSSKLVQTLLENHANIIINDENLLDLWVDQYNDMIEQNKNNEIHACHRCIDFAYKSQHDALKALFAACEGNQREAFVEKYPEFIMILENKI